MAFTALGWNGSHWIALGDASGYQQAYTSPDGSVWTPAGYPPSSQSYGVVWYQDRWYAADTGVMASP